jgi:Rad3-related DNA helicase
VAAERRRAAALDRAHHLELCVCEAAPHGLSPGGAVIAEDIRDLQRWTGHSRRRLLRRALLAGERRQLIERAQHVAQHLARDVRIARRRVELGMSQRPRVTLSTFLRH